MSLIQQNQLIINAKYKIEHINNNGEIFSAAISNDLKYIIVGESDCVLTIWNRKTLDRIKSIKFNQIAKSCKFTQDSKLLYVGIDFKLYQFYVKNNFKQLCKQNTLGKYDECIRDIFCISNTIILISSNSIIIKVDVNKKQQLLEIFAPNNHACGFDYNKTINLIASGSTLGYILLWSGYDGFLFIEKSLAHNHFQRIFQVLFIINNNQLISLDIFGDIIIWNINLQTQQQEYFGLIQQSGKNISLALQQQYLITTGKKFIKINTVKGDFIRQFDHQIENIQFHNTIQHDSMKVMLIQGRNKLYVCQAEDN